MGTFLHRLHVPNAFGGRAGFDMDESHVFPQSVLAAITWVESGPGDGGATAGAGCGVGLPSAQ